MQLPAHHVGHRAQHTLCSHRLAPSSNFQTLSSHRLARSDTTATTGGATKRPAVSSAGHRLGACSRAGGGWLGWGWFPRGGGCQGALRVLQEGDQELDS